MFYASVAATTKAFPPATVVLLICMAALVVAAGCCWPRVRGTTLVGPWCWVICTALAIGVVEGLIGLGMLDEGADAWRFAAAVGVFSPWMSLLGAKRPQDTAWHFIVASLWGVQALPAAEAILLRPGQPLAIIDFRAYFLIGLMGLSILVYLPTRYWLPGLLAAAGQAALLWHYLPFATEQNTGNMAIAGVLFVAATGLALLLAWRRREDRAFDRLWRDFRDAFGALWAARVMERVNASADMYAWPMRLGWSGFHAAENPLLAAEIPPEIQPELRRVMVNLLRRFVSDAWMDARLSGVVGRH